MWLADNRPTRYRMTVAEELAHVLLHRELIDGVIDVATFKALQNHYRWRTMERNTKRLAAAVLMPGECVPTEARLLYRQMVKAVGFENVPAVQNQLAVSLAKRVRRFSRVHEIQIGRVACEAPGSCPVGDAGSAQLPGLNASVYTPCSAISARGLRV